MIMRLDGPGEIIRTVYPVEVLDSPKYTVVYESKALQLCTLDQGT